MSDIERTELKCSFLLEKFKVYFKVNVYAAILAVHNLLYNIVYHRMRLYTMHFHNLHEQF